MPVKISNTSVEGLMNPFGRIMKVLSGLNDEYVYTSQEISEMARCKVEDFKNHRSKLSGYYFHNRGKTNLWGSKKAIQKLKQKFGL